MATNCRTVVYLALFSSAIGCGRDASRDSPFTSLESPDTLTLYSIDGREFEEGKEPHAEELYFKYPVLGKVEIKDPAKRKEIIAALNDGITQGNFGTMAKCFYPRHAIVAVEDGRKVEYIVCFECSQLMLYLDGELKSNDPISKGPEPNFNQHLEEAGIPLAPPSH